MKIVVFSDFFLPHIDGITTSLVHLIKSYAKDGHEVLVVAPRMKGSEHVSIPNVKIVFLPSMPAIFYPELVLGLLSPDLVLSLKNFAPDIVHVTGPGTVGHIGLFYANMFNIKSVATFHGYFMEPEYLKLVGIEKRGVKLAQKLLWKFAKSFYDKANIIVTPSKFVRKDLLSRNFKKNIVVINNAVDFSDRKFSISEHKKFINNHNLKNKKILLYIGRVSTEKNIKFLINILPLVLKKEKNVLLLIVGNGPELSNLKNQAKNLNVEKNIVFTGEIENKKIIEIGIHKIAKIFVTASHSEVQPMSIIEAFNFGLPLVCASSRGLSEMVSGNGYLISDDNEQKFSEAIVKILKDQKLHAKMSEKSHSNRKIYSIEFCKDKHLIIYKKLLNSVEKQSFPYYNFNKVNLKMIILCLILFALIFNLIFFILK